MVIETFCADASAQIRCGFAGFNKSESGAVQVYTNVVETSEKCSEEFRLLMPPSETEGVFDCFLNQTLKNTEFRVYRFPWALFSGPNSDLIIDFEKVWGRRSGNAKLNFNNTFLEESGNGVFHLPEEFAVTVIPNCSLVLSGRGSDNNYYHWHLNSLPAAFALGAFVKAHGLAVYTHPLRSWQLEGLRLLGFPYENTRQIFSRDSRLLFKDALWPSTYMKERILVPFQSAVFDQISQGVTARGDFGSRIFVSREDSSRRKLVNEADLFCALEPLGFKKIVPGTMSYEQQVCAFREANIIVGQHGAALTNIGFCSSGALLVELFGNNYINPCFLRLARVRNLNYAYYVSDKTVETNKRARGYHRQDFMVSINEVLHTVKYAIERAKLYFE